MVLNVRLGYLWSFPSSPSPSANYKFSSHFFKSPTILFHSPHPCTYCTSLLHPFTLNLLPTVTCIISCLLMFSTSTFVGYNYIPPAAYSRPLALSTSAFTRFIHACRRSRRSHTLQSTDISAVQAIPPQPLLSSTCHRHHCYGDVFTLAPTS